MKEGSEVRLKRNPGRIGVYAGKFRTVADKKSLQIRFPDGTNYIPEDEVECLSEEEELEHPIDLFEKGRFGRAGDLRRIMTHARLNGNLVNMLYSLESSNTEFYAYQFKPVLKFLQSPGKGILIADEVGLGKTIEAGLIWKELQSRFDTQKLMVVCPAMLREKWRMELKNRFGIKAEIVDVKETLKILKDAQWDGTYGNFAIITSFQGLRPNKGWEQEDPDKPSSSTNALAHFLKDNANEAPLVDLLIADEAHYMRNPKSQTLKFGRLLRDVSDHLVLLSATPIHLKNDDLHNLLRLVDENSFNRREDFEAILKANRPLVEMWEQVLAKPISQEELLELIQQALENPLLSKNRQLTALLEEPPSNQDLSENRYRAELAHRLENINLFSNVYTRTRKRDVQEWRVIREPTSESIPMTATEKEFYEKVTETVRDYCIGQESTKSFFLATPQRQMSSSMPAALRYWIKKKKEQGLAEEEEDETEEEEDETEEEEDETEERGPLVSELLSQLESQGELNDLRVNDLEANDSKYHRLISRLQEYFNQFPNEKVVLFATFRATLDYLFERLEKEGIESIVLKGGQQNKDEILETFKTGSPKVLLSSEVGSEGVDLQFCRLIVNYDLPWNPMRVEQRIGRLDRIGQKSDKITIWNLFYEDTIDSRIYARLHERLELFTKALGAMEPILGDEIRNLTINLLSKKFTIQEEEARILQTKQALENKRVNEEKLENEAQYLVAHGDYILNEVKAARQLNRWISEQDVFIYMRDFLNLHYSGCLFQQVETNPLIAKIRLSNEAKVACENFFRQHRLRDSSRLTRNDSSLILCEFNNKNKSTQNTSRKTEVISQLHPIVRFIGNQVDQRKEGFHPVVSVRLQKEQYSGIGKMGVYVFVIQQWSLKGLQDLEKLYFAAMPLDESTPSLGDEEAEKLVMEASLCGRDWLEAKNTIDLQKAGTLIFDKLMERGRDEFDQYVKNIQNQNEDRYDIRLRNLENHLQTKLENDERIRTEHLKNSREGLAKATQGKMDRLKDRIERQKIALSEKRNLSSDCKEIGLGLIEIH